MLPSSDSANLQALKCSEVLSRTVEEICNPLFTNFEITNFGYVKLYDNGTMLRLSADHEWSKKYFKYGFYNDVDFYALQKVPEGGIHKILVYGDPIGHHYSALYDHNIWNIIVIYERQKFFGNVWFFGSTREREKVIDFYLNNMSFLEHFILFFKQKLLDISLPQEEKILIRTKVRPYSSPFINVNCATDFLKKIKFNKFYLEGEHKDIALSKREFETLRYLSKGYTVKKIAALLKISPKTIESYINNVKKKTNGKCRHTIIDRFQKQYDFYT